MGMLQIYSSRQSFFQDKELHQADCRERLLVVNIIFIRNACLLCSYQTKICEKKMWFWVLKLTRVLLLLCGFTSCEESLHHFSLSTIIQRGLNSRQLGHLKTSWSLNLFWNKLWIYCNSHHCEGAAVSKFLKMKLKWKPALLPICVYYFFLFFRWQQNLQYQHNHITTHKLFTIRDLLLNLFSSSFMFPCYTLQLTFLLTLVLGMYRGCPKKHFLNCYSANVAFHCQLSSQLAVEDQEPSNPVSQNGNSKSGFFLGHSVYLLRRFTLQLVQLVVHVSLLHTPTQNTGPFLRWCCISRFILQQDHRRWKYHRRLWIIEYLDMIEFF